MKNRMRKILTIIMTLLLMTSGLSTIKARSYNGEVYREIETIDGHKGDEMVRVSIFLNDPGVLDKGYSAQKISMNRAASIYRNVLQNKQKNITNTIENVLGKELDVIWNLTLITNLISANVQYSDIERIREIKGVKAVFIEPSYTFTDSDFTSQSVNTVISTTGSYEVWQSGYTGVGTKIAILDTGLDDEHEMFDPDCFLHSIEEYETQTGNTADLMTAADIPASGLNGQGIYKNAKVPFAYNYGSHNTATNQCISVCRL